MSRHRHYTHDRARTVEADPRTPQQIAAEREAAHVAKWVRLNEILSEQHRYDTDPDYAAMSDADRVARQAAVYAPMNLIRDSALARRDAMEGRT